eukprot:m.636300 g.636300  ORF g.636300 m.636300 type:complete len:537 (-) comp22590_c0_seq1:110-1720(-)
MGLSHILRTAVFLLYVGISGGSSVSMYGQVSMQIESDFRGDEPTFSLSGTRVPNTGSNSGSHTSKANVIVIRPINYSFWAVPSEDEVDIHRANSSWVAVISAASIIQLQQNDNGNWTSSESVFHAMNQLASLAVPPAAVVVSNVNNSVSSVVLQTNTFEVLPPATAIFNSVELREVVASWQLSNDTDNATTEQADRDPIFVDSEEALISLWLFDRHLSSGPIGTPPRPEESTTPRSSSRPPNGGVTTDRESTGFYARTVAFVAFCILSFFIFTLYCRIKLGIMQNDMNNHIWVLALGESMSPSQLAVQKELVAAVVATMPTRTITAAEAAGLPSESAQTLATNETSMSSSGQAHDNDVGGSSETGPASTGGSALAATPPVNDHVALVMRSPSSTSDGKETCVICIETYEEGDVVRELPCAHEFHVECIDPWLAEHHTCPLCKLDILESSTSPPSSPTWRNRRHSTDNTGQNDIILTPLSQSTDNADSAVSDGVRDNGGTLGAFELIGERASGPLMDPPAISDSDEGEYLQVHDDFE